MNKTTVFAILIIPALLLLVGGIFFILGGIVNTGTSISPGLYRKIDKPLSIGKTVVLCPANQPIFQQARTLGILQGGKCPDNFDALFLKVAGKRKDIVTINAEGLFVNDILVAKNNLPLTGKDGQTLPAFSMPHYELKENEVVLLSEAPDNAFDSRHFGPVNVDQIESVISPIF